MGLRRGVGRSPLWLSCLGSDSISSMPVLPLQFCYVATPLLTFPDVIFLFLFSVLDVASMELDWCLMATVLQHLAGTKEQNIFTVFFKWILLAVSLTSASVRHYTLYAATIPCFYPCVIRLMFIFNFMLSA